MSEQQEGAWVTFCIRTQQSLSCGPVPGTPSTNMENMAGSRDRTGTLEKIVILPGHRNSHLRTEKAQHGGAPLRHSGLAGGGVSMEAGGNSIPSE